MRAKIVWCHIFLCIFRKFLCKNKNAWPLWNNVLKILKFFLVASELYVQPWLNARLPTPTFEKSRTGYCALRNLLNKSRNLSNQSIKLNAELWLLHLGHMTNLHISREKGTGRIGMSEVREVPLGILQAERIDASTVMFFQIDKNIIHSRLKTGLKIKP